MLIGRENGFRDWRSRRVGVKGKGMVGGCGLGGRGIGFGGWGGVVGRGGGGLSMRGADVSQ